MLGMILLQAAAGASLAKLGACIGAGIAAIAAGIGIAETTMTHMGQRIEEKWLHYKGQVII